MKTIENVVKVVLSVCSILHPSALASSVLYILQRHRTTFSGDQLLPLFTPPFPANAGHLPRTLVPQQSLFQMPVYSASFTPKLSLIPLGRCQSFPLCTLSISIIECVFVVIYFYLFLLILVKTYQIDFLSYKWSQSTVLNKVFYMMWLICLLKNISII